MAYSNTLTPYHTISTLVLSSTQVRFLWSHLKVIIELCILSNSSLFCKNFLFLLMKHLNASVAYLRSFWKQKPFPQESKQKGLALPCGFIAKRHSLVTSQDELILKGLVCNRLVTLPSTLPSLARNQLEKKLLTIPKCYIVWIYIELYIMRVFFTSQVQNGWKAVNFNAKHCRRMESGSSHDVTAYISVRAKMANFEEIIDDSSSSSRRM